MNVPVQGLVLLIGLLVFASYLIALMPGFWRGSFTARIEGVIRTRTPEGARTRASVRAMPTTAVFLLALCIMLLALSLVDVNAVRAGVAVGVVVVASLVYLTLVAIIARTQGVVATPGCR